MTQGLALALSIAVEGVVAALLAQAMRWSPPARAALAAALGTLATHPLLWPGIEFFEPIAGWRTAVVAAESLAVVVEALAYRLLATPRLSRALAFSAAANAASFGFGELLYAFDIA